MKISHTWLQEYFDEKLPSPREVADLLNKHAFEVEEIEQVGEDTVIEVDILPNRAHDANGLDGIACDLSAILEIPLKKRQESTLVTDTKSKREIKIEDFRCVRYQGLEIVNAQNLVSPEELKQKLEGIREKSISLIVDLTNVVMFETGQPMHAFDSDKLSGNISARLATAGEKMTTLDGKELDLTEKHLVIADEEKVLALAGIKGGGGAEVTLDTQNIFVEMANFDETYVRAISNHVGISTESSKRFQHGIHPCMTETARERFLAYLEKYLPNAKVISHEDVYPKPMKSYKVGVSTEEVNGLLGTDLTQDNVAQIFDRLSFSYEIVEDPRNKIVELAKEQIGKPYKSGASVLFEGGETFDCSSLSSWLYVHAGITIPRMCIDQTVFTDEVAEADLQPGDIVFANTKRLVHKTEIETASQEFMPGTPFPEGSDHLAIYIGDGEIIHATCYENINIVVQENYKDSKSFGENIVKFGTLSELNSPRFVVTVPDERLDLRVKQDLIEEVARIYGLDNIALAPVEDLPGQDELNQEYLLGLQIKDLLITEGFSEIYTSSFVKKGEREVAKPAAKDRPFLRTTLVTGMEQSLDKNKHTIDLQSSTDLKLFELGKVFPKDREVLKLSLGVRRVQGGKKVKSHEVLKDIVAKLEGQFGITPPEIKDQQEIVEIDLQGVSVQETEKYPRFYECPIKEFSPISAYPYIARDIAIWAPGTESDEIQNELTGIIESASGELLAKINLFDVFSKPDEDGNDQTSYAYRMVYQSHERTLEDDEIREIMETVNLQIAEKGWEVR